MGSQSSKLPASCAASNPPPCGVAANSFPSNTGINPAQKVDEAIEVSPTKSTNPGEELVKRQQKYKYSYSKNIPGAPFLDNLPIEQHPSFEWTALLVKQGVLLFQDAIKHAGEDVGEILGKARSIFEIFHAIRNGIETEKNQPSDIEGYLATIYDSPDKIPSVSLLDSDEAFGYWRVAGPNPTTLAPVELKASISWILGLEGCNKYIERARKAFAEKRLYQVDYSKLAEFSPSSATKFTMGAIALFEIPTSIAQVLRHSLTPLCIKINSRETREDEIIYPHEEFRWKIAKGIFNSLDGFE